MPTASEVVIGNSLSIPDKGIYFFASNSTDNSSTGLLLKYRLASFSLNFIFINIIAGLGSYICKSETNGYCSDGNSDQSEKG